MDEAVYKGLVIEPWFGLMARKKTPAAIVERLNRAFNEALTAPDVVKRLADMEITPGGGTRAAFGAHMAAETRRWGNLIKARGIHAEELK